MMLAGLPVADHAVDELAALVRATGADDLADRLEDAAVRAGAYAADVFAEPTGGVVIRIPSVAYELNEAEKRLVIDELRKMNPWAAAVAGELKHANEYEPGDEDRVELCRALDHLRNLGTLPSGRPISHLRDALQTAFSSRTYRIIPEDGGEPYDANGYGPIHAPPERLVDAFGHEWQLVELREGTDPIEVVVRPWAP